MARPWYSNDRFRQVALGAGTFLGVLLIIWLSSRIPAINRLYTRLEAGTVRLATKLGNGLERLTSPESSTASLHASCQEDLRALTLDQANLAALESQVAELQGLLAYTQANPSPGQTAQVIARAVAEDTTQVIIDKGSEHGLKAGSAVIVDEGHLFGLVAAVRQWSSTVQLLSNPQVHVPSTILGETRTLGLVEGRAGSLLVMEFIPQDATIEVNDLVVTSGLDGLIKQNLVVGLVTEVIQVESAPFKRALIEILYEPREWTTVYVLPPPEI